MIYRCSYAWCQMAPAQHPVPWRVRSAPATSWLKESRHQARLIFTREISHLTLWRRFARCLSVSPCARVGRHATMHVPCWLQSLGMRRCRSGKSAMERSASERLEEGLHFAFWPTKGEYANVTEFVTDPMATEELQFDAGDMPIVDLAMFSDGLERLALDFNAGEVHAPFFSGLFPYLYRCSPGHLLELESQMSAFLGSERVNARTDDDKTLILATRQHDAS